jgi:beta-lactamase regulating signal transducer with metallopeptidase domain
MNHFSFLYSPVPQALGYAVVNSLWQSLIIFICLRLILKSIQYASSRFKYTISYFALLCMAAWFTVTFFQQLSLYQNKLVAAQIMQHGFFQEPIAGYSSKMWSGWSFSFLHHYFPWLAIIYVTGITWFGIRLMLNYFQTIRFRINGISDLSSEWLDQIEVLAGKLGIQHPVYTYISQYITTPMMVGFFRPVILLPLAAVNNLSPGQIEAILLHELAHIRRNDYLLNLIQSVMDAVLFFNPFAWWISKNIREEREKCCDEMVLQISDPYHYARALLALEEFGFNNHKLMMAAANKRSHLLHRIKNIMEMKKKYINLNQKLIAVAIIISAVISVAWLTPKKDSGNGNQKELQNTNKTLPAVSDQKATTTFLNQTSFLKFISDSITPLKAPPLPPLPPLSEVPPLSTLPPLPPAPPLPPVPPLPPSVTMDGLKDTIPSLENYFNSDEWKKQQDEIKKSTEKIQQYFKGPEWQKQMEDMNKSAASLQKFFQSKAWKQQQEAIKNSTAEVQKYFSSPEWKKQQDEIKKHAQEMKKYFNSDEWKKQRDEIKKSAEKMKQYFNSDEWKKQQDEIKKHAEEMKKYFNSDEWKKQQKEKKDSLKTSLNGKSFGNFS